MSLSPRDAAFLLTCLRFLGADAPCQARIEAVIASVAGTDHWADCRVPGTVFARALSLAAIIWAIDSELVGEHDRYVAQGVLEHIWSMGPIRPELIGAQLRCLVGQDDGDRRCRWTCPAMLRANAEAEGHPGRIPQPGLLDIAWAVGQAAASTDPEQAREPVRIARWRPARGARVRCRECGRLGTVLGTDAVDGWTVVEHHPPVAQRADGMWEVLPSPDTGPRQCRYLASREAARVV